MPLYSHKIKPYFVCWSLFYIMITFTTGYVTYIHSNLPIGQTKVRGGNFPVENCCKHGEYPE